MRTVAVIAIGSGVNQKSLTMEDCPTIHRRCRAAWVQRSPSPTCTLPTSFSGRCASTGIYVRARRTATSNATAHAPRIPISEQAAPIQADAGL